MVKFKELKGSPWQRGFQSGELFKDHLKKLMAKHQAELNNSILMKKVNDMILGVTKRFPEYFEEIRGRAAGAEVNEQFYFLLMCPELQEINSGCTSLVYRKPNGKLILSHNEDDSYEDGELTMVKVLLEDNSWFVSNDLGTMPWGNGFSWNSHGIVKIINYTHPIKYDIGGISRYFAQRHITEASSIDDFIERSRATKWASGYHAFVLDINTQRAVSIEMTDDDMSIIEIDNCLAHANHYSHPKIAKGKIYIDEGSNSVFRLNTVTRRLKELKGDCNFVDLRNILEYKSDKYENSVLIKNGVTDYLTMANFSIDTEDKRIHLRFYFPEQEDFVLEYNQFIHI